MEVLKKIFVFLLDLLLVNLIGSLVLSFAIEQVVQKDIITELVKQSIVEESASSDLPEEQQAQLDKFLQDEETTKYITALVTEVLDSIGDDKEFDENVVDSFLDYIISNKDKLETATGTSINIAELEEFKNSQEYRDLKEETRNELKQLNEEADPTVKEAIKTYRYMISGSFKVTLLILIAINILVIAVVERSLDKLLINVGRSFYSSGFMLIIFYCLVKVLFSALAEQGYSISLHSNVVLISGLVLTALGIALAIVFKKRLNKKEGIVL